MKEGRTTIEKEHLQAQQKLISALTKQINTVGREAVEELRNTVKTKLLVTIRRSIKSACEEFVRAGNNHGAGVKNRILELFEDLTEEATLATKELAIRILQENATRVRIEVQEEIKKVGDHPLQDTAELTVESDEVRIRRPNVQKQSYFERN